jgi:hypothetical protein
VNTENLKPIVDKMVDEAAHLMTDSPNVLANVATRRKHYQVNHTIVEYARRENGVCITTKRFEGYCATLKRGVNGVYRHVGKHHLHRYLREFDFRYNAQEVTGRGTA